MSEGNTPGGGQPPYPAYPPGPYDAPPPRSDRWKIWVGIALAIPALMATAAVVALAGAIDNSGALSGLVGIACLVAPIVLLFFPATRKIALGLLIGYAVIVILLGGACVALLSSYN
jgi:hypothetical protein